MKSKDIREGGRYIGKVGTRVVVVEVIGRPAWGNGWRVRSLLTGYETTYRSAQKFRREATDEDVALIERRKAKPKRKRPAARPAPAPAPDPVDGRDYFRARRERLLGWAGEGDAGAAAELNRRAEKRAAALAERRAS